MDAWYHLKKLFTIHIPLQVVQGLSEALEVDDLPLPQEPQKVYQVGIIVEIDQIFIGCPGIFFTAISSWMSAIGSPMVFIILNSKVLI